ncbi:MAG: MBL fold metallo-hydrolase [Pseudomonadota bacterium]
MFLLNRRNFLQMTAGAGALTAAGMRPALAATGADVFTADPMGGLVDSTLVVGEERLLLIDAQFTAPNAQRLADVIAATGKTLETIFITHYHPDHHLGLAILMERFPEAKPVAHASVQPLIAGAAQAMLDGMKQALPPELFGDTAVIPEALPGDTLELEGERFDILGPVHGDTEVITPVHLPQLDTLVAADVLYQDTHLWVAENLTGEDLNKWRATLDDLESLGAGTVIPGHRTESSANDASVYAHMRTYLDAWEAAMDVQGSAEDLRAAMIEAVGDLPGGLFLDRGVAAARG